MKTRNGYVSNSSSSSFLVAFDNFNAFDGMSKREGYKEFVSDVKESLLNDEIHALEFFEVEYHSIINCYSWMYRNSKNGLSYNDPSAKFLDDCEKMGCEIDGELDSIIMEGLMYVKKYEDNGGYYDYSVIDSLAERFSKKVVEKAKEKWRQFSVLEYSDDTMFGSYMEQDFMPSLQRMDGNFAVISRSEH